MKKIIVCDAIHNSGIKLLQDASDIEYLDASKMPKDELLKIVGEYDIAITRSSTDVDEKFLSVANNIKSIVRAGVGVDNVNIPACSQKGIIVMNVPTANTIAAVELTMTHILAAARSFPYAHNHLKNERIWKREKWYGVELMNKKLGVIGFGNIGSRVGIRAKSFGMEVITYDPYINPSKATNEGVKYTENFEDILKCDFITIHTPKNQETIDMISDTEIDKMKDGVRLINVARGGLYNEDALYKNLKSGKIAFAGVDVFTKEPATDNILLDLDNINVTPHLGANTYESQEKIAIQAAQAAMSAARELEYPNALNLPVSNENMEPCMAEYLNLTNKLAHIVAQMNKGPISKIKIQLDGEVSEYRESLMTYAIVGALKESMGENINYVNAQIVAEEKNIEVITSVCEEAKVYKNKVSITIATDKDSTTVGGTIFESNMQRIIEINGVDLDIEPKGKMVLFKNQDVPGVIAKITSILAKHNINIADFRLGRDNRGFAIAAVLVYDNISKNILKELEAVQECQWISFIEV